MRLARFSIRARLMLWYALALAVTLLIFGAGIYYYVRANLFDQIETRLEEDIGLLTRTVNDSPEELREIEAHTLLSLFRVEEGGWPLYISGGWVAAGLDEALKVPPAGKRMIWQSPQQVRFHLKQAVLRQGGLEYSLAVAQDSELIHQSLRRLAVTLLVASPLALLVSLLGGYFLAARVLAPIQEMTGKARAISADNLSDRLTIRNPDDELGKLGAVLNDTFMNLEQSFVRLKRFTQDAAHELRTPLAVIRSVGEVGLQDRKTAEAYREIIGSMLEEVDRLARLVDGLLTLTRADSDSFHLNRRPEDLGPLCAEVTDWLRVLAEEKHQRLSFTSAGRFSAVVDRDSLRLALFNIIANAIRFTPALGEIHTRLRADGPGNAVIEISDNGPGIASEHLPHLFDRFYRVDPSRSAETGGAGLGLAIAQWAAKANGGRIEVESEPGNGTSFRVILPQA